MTHTVTIENLRGQKRILSGIVDSYIGEGYMSFLNSEGSRFIFPISTLSSAVMKKEK